MEQNKATTFLERWQALTITDRYIFYRVMRDNHNICLKLLQLILPELDIQRIEFLVEEKQIEETPESRGVRLDAYAGDGIRVYDIEIQAQTRIWQHFWILSSEKNQIMFLRSKSRMLWT